MGGAWYRWVGLGNEEYISGIEIMTRVGAADTVVTSGAREGKERWKDEDVTIG